MTMFVDNIFATVDRQCQTLEPVNRFEIDSSYYVFTMSESELYQLDWITGGVLLFVFSGFLADFIISFAIGKSTDTMSSHGHELHLHTCLHCYNSLLPYLLDHKNTIQTK